MTLEEAAHKYDMPPDTLRKYAALGLIRTEQETFGEAEYMASDFERLGLIDTLLRFGFTPEEARKYLRLTENNGSDEIQIRMLQRQRRTLLNDIHKKQQLLDNLDYMIREKKKD